MIRKPAASIAGCITGWKTCSQASCMMIQPNRTQPAASETAGVRPACQQRPRGGELRAPDDHQQGDPGEEPAVEEGVVEPPVAEVPGVGHQNNPAPERVGPVT